MKPVPLHHPPAATKVWDPFVLEPGKTAHEWVGYTASALVLARLVLGFVGSRHARFSDFFPTPRRLAKHRGAIRNRQHPVYVGHNPLGALMMLALMAIVLALGVTGGMQTTDTFFGEEWLMEWHEGLANGLLLAAGLHAAAAIVMGRLGGVRLVRAVVTGPKRHF